MVYAISILYIDEFKGFVMPNLISESSIKSSISEDHFKKLLWADANKGQIIPWMDLAKDDFRICTVVEGIYKPKDTDYTLSTKQLIDSPYADRLPKIKDDGSWTYEYFQKGQNPTERDKYAQNRGLIKCMEDNIPVIVCIQQSKKPQKVTYLIQGIGLVKHWNSDGYFNIEGVSFKTEIGEGKFTNELIDSSAFVPNYDPTTEEDGREKTFRAISIRRGQPKFRKELLEAYSYKCAITGTAFESVLEAAHITKYNGTSSNVVTNGLLLRADIHTLWDLGLVALTMDYKVIIAQSLKNTVYAELEGHRINLPKNTALWPSQDCLSHHRQIYDI